MPKRWLGLQIAGNLSGICGLYVHANGIHTAKRCTMDHANHTRLQMSDLTSATLEGCTIYDPMDEDVGSVSHVHGNGANMQVSVDVGTFLGMGGKTVLIPVSALQVMKDEDGDIHATTTMTKDQIEALPEHEHM